MPEPTAIDVCVFCDHTPETGHDMLLAHGYRRWKVLVDISGFSVVWIQECLPGER